MRCVFSPFTLRPSPFALRRYSPMSASFVPNSNLFTLYFSGPSSPRKWIFNKSETSATNYYMVGGRGVPVVGGDEGLAMLGDKKALETGWVMSAHIGKAKESCFPYRGAPDACSANRVCTCDDAPYATERVVSRSGRLVQTDNQEDILMCCDTPMEYMRKGYTLTSSPGLNPNDYRTWNKPQYNTFYRESCRTTRAAAACECKVLSARPCTISLPDPTPTLSLQVPSAYLSSSFWDMGGHTMRLFAFSLKRKGEPNPSCSTLRNYYQKNGPRVNAYDVSPETAGQCQPRTSTSNFNCSAGPRYKCDKKIYKCVQDTTGTYELESECSSTCYDVEVLKAFTADATGKDGNDNTGDNSGSAQVERFVCDIKNEKCTREKFNADVMRLPNHYDDGIICNEKCTPQIKYECAGAPDYKCIQAATGTFDSTSSCKQNCHAVGDAGCTAAGSFCTTNGGADGICKTAIGPCDEIKQEESQPTNDGAGSAASAESTCQAEGKWCRTGKGAEGKCAKEPGVNTGYRCEKNAAAAPQNQQVSGQIKLDGIAIQSASVKLKAETSIINLAGADSGVFKYTVVDGRRREQELDQEQEQGQPRAQSRRLAAKSTTMAYTLAFVDESAAVNSREKLKMPTFKGELKQKWASSNFAAFATVTVTDLGVEDTAEDKCNQEPGTEWKGSSCRDVCVINCNCKESYFGCCPGTITDVAQKDLTGSNCVAVASASTVDCRAYKKCTDRDPCLKDNFKKGASSGPACTPLDYSTAMCPTKTNWCTILKTSCPAAARFGCCEDGFTPMEDQAGLNCPCAESSFGCCLGEESTNIAKSNGLGSNCPCTSSLYGCCPSSQAVKVDAGGSNCNGASTLGGQACPAGRVPGAGGRCKDCLKGTYNPAAGSTTCEMCPMGQYESKVASIACKSCQPGRSSIAMGAVQCDGCPMGHFAGDGQMECTMCAAGMYADQDRQSVCKACPTAEAGAAGAISCEVTCTESQVKCPDGSPDTCKFTIDLCACPTATPAKCADGSCMISAGECSEASSGGNKGGTACTGSQVKCPDGACVNTKKECACPSATPAKCANGSCMITQMECA